MVVKLKAIKPLTYAGKRIVLWQEFDVRGERDASVLCAIKSATRVTAAVSVPKPMYRTRMMTAQAPHVLVALPEMAQSEPDSVPVPVQPESEPVVMPEPVISDLDSMDRDALYDMAVSLGMKPHHLMGAAKLRAAIIAHRAAE